MTVPTVNQRGSAEAASTGQKFSATTRWWCRRPLADDLRASNELAQNQVSHEESHLQVAYPPDDAGCCCPGPVRYR